MITKSSKVFLSISVLKALVHMSFFTYTYPVYVQVEMQKKERLLERQSKQLSVSQRVIAEQEEELAEVTKELEETEKENTRLWLSMEKMLEENDCNRQM